MRERKQHFYSAKDVSFHLATSDRDLVSKVSDILKRTGHVSFSDSMGKEHYLLDGRKGAREITRHIDSVSKRLKYLNKDDFEKVRPYFSNAIDHVLEMSGIPNNLKGYRYVRYMLFRLIEDDSLVSPMSKTLFPEMCEFYLCNHAQIERDIRYAIKKSYFCDAGPSPKIFVCTLLEFATKMARDSLLKSNQKGINESKKLNEEFSSLDNSDSDFFSDEVTTLEKYSPINTFPDETVYKHFQKLLTKSYCIKSDFKKDTLKDKMKDTPKDTLEDDYINL